MIESLAIKSHLKARFVANEVVFVRSRGTHAKVQGSAGDRYTLRTLSERDLGTVEAYPDDMVRKDHLSKGCILRFLESITKDSPFGRVLRKNILHDMSIFSKEKASSLGVGRRGQSRDTLFSRRTGGYHAYGEMDKSYEVRAEDSFGDAGGSSDLGAKLTSHTEEAVAAESASYEKKKRTQQRDVAMPSSQNDEETCTSHNKAGSLHLKNKFSTIGSALEFLDCTSVEIKGICDLELFVEVYLLFSHFRKYFNIELSKDGLAEALLDRSYGTEIAFRVHKALLSVLSAELSTAGQSQFKQILENAMDICVPENGALGGVPPLEKYDWANADIAEHNWKDVMENFCSQIYHTYGLHGIAFYREFTSGSADDATSDRLGIVKFLMECTLCTNTFRQVVNACVEEARQYDKSRHGSAAKPKRHRSSTSDTESLGRAADVDAPRTEKSIVPVERKTPCNRYRADIANIDGVQFVYFEGRICFWKDKKFYMMSTEQVKYLQSAYMPQGRHHRSFSALLKSYFSLPQRVASNTNEMYLSDRESI
ncbi:UNVERIFIED_CONTAM: hypothetical protein PYX00_011888 [Menopon gallinae]|uniref:DUF5097 domain-containing protein n=1 Tax=Menopon gallinae TaxID=328185 RepID=A0AAW2H8Y0_9NEOP